MWIHARKFQMKIVHSKYNGPDTECAGWVWKTARRRPLWLQESEGGSRVGDVIHEVVA